MCTARPAAEQAVRARLQFPRVAEDGARCRHIPETEVLRDAVQINFTAKAVDGVKRLQLGGEEPTRTREACHVQRFLAQPVAGEKQAAINAIPDSQREHAPESGDCGLRAEGRRRLGDDLGIRGAPEAHPPPHQLRAQVPVVVDLSVEDTGVPSVRRQHRLAAGLREVEDGQPAVSQSDPCGRVDPAPAVVRTPVNERSDHATDSRIKRFRIAFWRGEPSGYAASGCLAPLR